MLPILLEKLNAFIIVFDLNNKDLIWANDHFLQATGNYRKFSHNLPFSSFLLNVHPEDRDRLLIMMEKAKDNRTNEHNLVYRIKSKSADWIWVFSHFSKYDLIEKKADYCINFGTEINCSRLKEQLIIITEEEDNCFKNELIKILTKREREIYQLIAEGNTNKEISDILNISINTTKIHRKRIKQKMGIKKNSILIKTAVEHSLI